MPKSQRKLAIPTSTSGQQASPLDGQTSVSELKEIVRTFVAERNWEKFHNAKNLSMALSIEAAELMEHFQWLTAEQVACGDAYDRQAVADELADVTCYALAIANALDIDLSSAIVKKMGDNRRKYPL